MTATWTVLGAGTILPREGYGCAGHALRPAPGSRVTLFDCGPGTLRRLPSAGIGLVEIERVAISHFHPDHWLDLLTLAFARRNAALRPLPELELVGPRGLADLLERAASIFGARTWLRFEATTITEVEPAGGALERGEFTLSWAPTSHTPESVAWRADVGDSSVAYSGDSGESAAVAELARGVGVFVCECSFPDDHPFEHHLTPSSAGRLAAAAGCGRLVLTHFYPSVDPGEACERAARHFGGPIEASRDGSVHALSGGGARFLI